MKNYLIIACLICVGAAGYLGWTAWSYVQLGAWSDPQGRKMVIELLVYAGIGFFGALINWLCYLKLVRNPLNSSAQIK